MSFISLYFQTAVPNCQHTQALETLPKAYSAQESGSRWVVLSVYFRSSPLLQVYSMNWLD